MWHQKYVKKKWAVFLLDLEFLEELAGLWHNTTPVFHSQVILQQPGIWWVAGMAGHWSSCLWVSCEARIRWKAQQPASPLGGWSLARGDASSRQGERRRCSPSCFRYDIFQLPFLAVWSWRGLRKTNRCVGQGASYLLAAWALCWLHFLSCLETRSNKPTQVAFSPPSVDCGLCMVPASSLKVSTVGIQPLSPFPSLTGNLHEIQCIFL